MNDQYRDAREVQRTSSGAGPSAALIVFAIVVILAVVFFFQNGERTQIDFLFVEKRTTVRWSLIVAAALGVLADRVFTIWWRRRRRRNDDR